MLCRVGEPLFAIARDARAPAWRRAIAIQAAALGDSEVEPTIAALAGIASQKGATEHLVSGALGAGLLVLKRRIDDDPDGDLDSDACQPLVTALLALILVPLTVGRITRSIRQVAATVNRAESTTVQYLCEFIQENEINDPAPWVDPKIAQKIQQAIRKIGAKQLKLIFDHLNGQVDYNRIRIVLACMRNV